MCSCYFLFVKILLSTPFPEAKITTIPQADNIFSSLIASVILWKMNSSVEVNLNFMWSNFFILNFCVYKNWYL